MGVEMGKANEKKSHLMVSDGVCVCVNGGKLKKFWDGILLWTVVIDSCTLGDTRQKKGVRVCSMFLCSMESVLAVCCSARTMYSICTCSSTSRAPAGHADRYRWRTHR